MRGRTLLAWAEGGRFLRLHARPHSAARYTPNSRRHGVFFGKQTMTSKERKEARYRRRKARREEKRLKATRDALDFDKVFSYMNLYHSAQKCFKGVSWKASVQMYKSRCGINVARRLRDLKHGVLKLRDSPEFVTRERGHERRINSIHIEDRVPEKCNSKYSLKQVLHRSLLYDNYASQDAKGTGKARARLKCMLERHIRRHGMTGGMIVFDFKGFFNSIQHILVRHVMDKHYSDRRITGFNMRIVQKKRKKVGLILGSENSQDFAVSTPDALDHYIKERLHMEGYGRYMDDGWIIHPDLEHLKKAYERIRAFAAKLGFTLNEKKTRIIRFGQPFTMLKRKYSFTRTGGIIIRPVRESVIRERRKLKRLYRRFKNGTLPLEAGLNSLNAWKASLSGCRCHKIVHSMERLYNDLYIGSWMPGLEVQNVLPDHF